MKTYKDTKDETRRFYVRGTLNGYSLQVLLVERDENIPLTPQLAARMTITLPDSYRLQSCTREDAEAVLEEVAKLNGWEVADTEQPDSRHDEHQTEQ